MFTALSLLVVVSAVISVLADWSGVHGVIFVGGGFCCHFCFSRLVQCFRILVTALSFTKFLLDGLAFFSW